MRKLLDHRFDAFAAETHENLAPRAAVALGAGGGALMLLPWRLCAIWTVSILAYELWGWFASRQQFLGRPASFGERLGFATFLACLTSCWFLLGMGFWLTGTMDGAVCAAIVWASVIGFAIAGARQIFAAGRRLELPLAAGALARDAELAAALDRPLRLLLVEDVAVNRELVRTTPEDEEALAREAG